MSLSEEIRVYEAYLLQIGWTQEEIRRGERFKRPKPPQDLADFLANGDDDDE